MSRYGPHVYGLLKLTQRLISSDLDRGVNLVLPSSVASAAGSIPRCLRSLCSRIDPDQ